MDSNNNGSVTSSEILEENNYYPFGLKHKGYNNNPVTNHPYKYNGKELDEDLGLNWYHYGFRMYDPALGRFPSIDPISDQFPHVSTYNYAENDPVANIDLHGLQKWGMQIGHEKMKAHLKKNGTAQDMKEYMGAVNKMHSYARTSAAVMGVALAGAGAIATYGVAGTATIVANEIKDEGLSYLTNGASDYLDVSKGLYKLGKAGLGKANNLLEYFAKGTSDISTGTAKLSNGGLLELDFNVPDGMKGEGIGTNMFNDALKTFGDDVKGIKGTWVGGDNLSAFQKALKKTNDINVAIFSTPTGKWAKRNGFDQATITGSHVGENGYEGLEIIFNKSK